MRLIYKDLQLESRRGLLNFFLSPQFLREKNLNPKIHGIRHKVSLFDEGKKSEKSRGTVKEFLTARLRIGFG